MQSLKIPYGINDAGELVSAENATKDCLYFCPCCSTKLIYKAGDIRAKHFSHSFDSTCNIETILHKTAKLLIKQAITDNATNKRAIDIKHCCGNCQSNFLTKLPLKTFSKASEEIKVSDYICDVVGYRSTEIALGIEILVTHKVSEDKAKNLPIYWVELNAEEVIKKPYQWHPTQSQLKTIYCPDCKNHFKHIQQIADKWGIDKCLYSPVKNPEKSPYIAEIETCFKCKEKIPVFWWRGVPFCESEPPTPRPKTIKYRKSKTYGGSYWANTCANCGMLQGDNFLFLFPNAPLRGLPLSNETLSQTKPVASLRVLAGDEAVSEFMNVMNRMAR